LDLGDVPAHTQDLLDYPLIVHEFAGYTPVSHGPEISCRWNSASIEVIQQLALLLPSCHHLVENRLEPLQLLLEEYPGI